jgi:SAM-dependent methyltransferase
VEIELDKKKKTLRDYRYRAYVGPADKYDLISANQFNLMTSLGLRDTHYLLDIGCGSLAGGRLFIPYLLPGRYYGVDPVKWLIQEGIKNEVGEDIIRVKNPVFRYSSDFDFSFFDRKFDYIIAQSIFSHAPEVLVRKCLMETSKVMKPTSSFAFTFFEGDENYDGYSWVYPDFVSYTLEFMHNLFMEYGFDLKVLDWEHPFNQKWILARIKAKI